MRRLTTQVKTSFNSIYLFLHARPSTKSQKIQDRARIEDKQGEEYFSTVISGPARLGDWGPVMWHRTDWCANFSQ
jgi:hypothetical protein